MSRVGLSGWLDAVPDGVQEARDGRGVFTTCRCGARVEASAPDQVRAMLAGHWMFDAGHAAFVAGERVAS